MPILLRQNKISKWFSGIGQEATSVGVALATNSEEYILPMHRNLGVFTCRDISLVKLFNQFQGKVDGFTKGRDRSFHFGVKDLNIVGMISHLGPQMGIADGIGLAKKLKNEKKATVVFTGDGGTSEGDFHESLNVAAVWDLPVLFVIENNGYGLSTPNTEQFKGESLAVRGEGYGEQLLMKAEDFGREKNCSFSTLDTMDFEAKDFYVKFGYEVEFERKGFDKDSTMYMLRKQL